MEKAEKLIKELALLRDKRKALTMKGFFKTGRGDYGEGDVFWGISVPVQRKLVQDYLDIDLRALQVLLQNKVHEVRFSSALILLYKYNHDKESLAQKNIFEFYLKNLELFNSWDLIDLTAHRILGDYLLTHNKPGAIDVLINLAHSDNLWRRRSAVVATFAFIKAGSATQIKEIASILQNDSEELIAKACGWMLREMGKHVSQDSLRAYLDENYKKMHRATLRQAIERLAEAERKAYLKRS